MLRVYTALGALCAVAALASLAVGAGDLADARLAGAFLALRAQRAGAAFLAGAALGAAGALVQGLFRNPLADPAILGTSAGAALGGRLALLASELWLVGGASGAFAPELTLPAGCLLGALAALGALLAVQRAGDEVVVLLLCGFLLSSLFVSLAGLATSLAEESWQLARAMLQFGLGDVSGAGPRRLLLALPLVLAGCGAAWLWARPLDLLLSGEDEARALGVDVAQLRGAAILWTAVLTAAAVTLAGSIGFVGLIAPHALRRWTGPLHRRLIPACALGGGAFVVACDALARALPARSEVPLGVVTGLLGAPLFLALLVRSRRELTGG